MGVTLILSTIMAVAGVMVLRVREPQLSRPYKIPLYPLPPLVFLIISFWVLGHASQRNPIESIVGVGLLLIGIPLYFLTGHNSGKSTDKTES
jgi:APA family basic amino acid/polyamine antiporter